jgi:hypothetical protein
MKSVKCFYLYLYKSKEINFEFRILLHLLENETESRKCRDVTILLERSTANESWLQKVLAIEFITVKRMILEQSKKEEEHFFENVNSMY